MAREAGLDEDVSVRRSSTVPTLWSSTDFTVQPCWMPWMSFSLMRAAHVACPLIHDQVVRPTRARRGTRSAFAPQIRTGTPSRWPGSIVPPSRRRRRPSRRVAPDAAEMARRMATTIERTPWLVAEADGRVVGYAYAISPSGAVPLVGRHLGLRRPRASRDRRRARCTTRSSRCWRGFVNVYAGIALPNAASAALHEGIGMRRIGVYERVGWKFGAWHDVAWYGMRIAEPSARRRGRASGRASRRRSQRPQPRAVRRPRAQRLALRLHPSRGASMMRSMARRAWKAEP